MSKVDNKIVLITGCNGGIGLAMCSEFAKAGYIVVGTDRHAANKAGGEQYISCDLSKLTTEEATQQQFRDSVSDVMDKNSAPLHAIINNAALQITAPLAKLSAADFIISQQVNVAAPFVLAKLFEQPLRQARGAIVNIGSIHAKLTKPDFCAYATSKAALSGLTRALALEFADEVTVNTISPAATKTEMLLDGFKGQMEKYQQLAAYHPVKRIAEPEEIARLALFLCSEHSRFITGAELPIDGGIGGVLHDPGC